MTETREPIAEPVAKECLYRTDSTGRVTLVHSQPDTLDAERRADGYLIDPATVPEAPVCARGEEAVLFVRTDLKEPRFEWEVQARPLTEQEAIDARLEAIEARVTKLEGGAVRA